MDRKATTGCGSTLSAESIVVGDGSVGVTDGVDASLDAEEFLPALGGLVGINAAIWNVELTGLVHLLADRAEDRAGRRDDCQAVKFRQVGHEAECSVTDLFYAGRDDGP